MDAKTRDLLNRDVDGAVNDADRLKVQRLLKRSAEARRLHAELTGLSRLLSSVPEFDPPVHLANRIRAAVHGNDAPVATAHQHVAGENDHPRASADRPALRVGVCRRPGRGAPPVHDLSAAAGPCSRFLTGPQPARCWDRRVHHRRRRQRIRVGARHASWNVERDCCPDDAEPRCCDAPQFRSFPDRPERDPRTGNTVRESHGTRRASWSLPGSGVQACTLEIVPGRRGPPWPCRSWGRRGNSCANPSRLQSS